MRRDVRQATDWVFILPTTYICYVSVFIVGVLVLVSATSGIEVLGGQVA